MSQQTQSMNPNLFARFFQAVKDGKVEGFQTREGEIYPPSPVVVFADDDDSIAIDVFCVDIRRWLTSEGVTWYLHSDAMLVDEVSGFPLQMKHDSEVDRRLAAALWWLEQKGSQ